MKSSLHVMKFGGASIQDAASIQNVCDVIGHFLHRVPLVLVFSAMGKTTSKLLQAGRLAAEGQGEKASALIDTLFLYHMDLCAEIFTDTSEALEFLKDYRQQVLQFIEGTAQTHDFSAKSQDWLLAHGELISSRIMEILLQQRGFKVQSVDARTMIFTNSSHTAAEVLMAETRQAIQEKMAPVLQMGVIPVVQGFLGATLSGVTTTLGFEGSDYTAALLGAALDAATVDVWKDVDGVMSVDPSLCSEAKVLPCLSYTEAATLTFLGAKVLHAKTLAPLEKQGIPIHVRPLHDREAAGTIIGQRPGDMAHGIRSITCRELTVTVTVTGHAHILPHRLMFEISGLFHTLKLQPIYLALSENCVTAILEDNRLILDRLDDLAAWGQVQLHRDAGTVSLVGEGLHCMNDAMEQALKRLGDYDIRFISAGLSPLQMTFGLHSQDVVPAVLRLHKYFFEERSLS